MADLHPEDQYFHDNFNTELSPEEEQRFQSWAKESGKNPDLETIDYDLRGFWKGNNKFDDKNGHGSDEFKKPNHPSFSDQSKYHGTEAPWGSYVGGKWSESGKSYTPSVTMLRHTHSASAMKDYFNKYEPDTKLNLPAEFR
jgi:hypothetical protein